MGYQSKTWSLSDEVVQAVEEARRHGLSPNQYFRQLIGLDPATTEAIQARVAAKNAVNVLPAKELLIELDEAEKG